MRTTVVLLILLLLLLVISYYYNYHCCSVNVIYTKKKDLTSLDKIPLGVSNDQLSKVPWFPYRAHTKLSQ